jgi:putative hydrolase of the HAD superfamily
MWRGVSRAMHAQMPEMQSVDVEAWFQALHERFDHGEIWRMYDDVPEVLVELRRRGLLLGIVSNWDTRLRRIVREIGLLPLVDFVKISAEVGRRKPDGAIFKKALAEAGVEPHEAMHVGDQPLEDVEGARAAGLRAVLIRRDDGVFGSGAGEIRTLHELLDRVP